MKILNINRRSVGQVEIALPFETDAHVSRAWEYLVAGRHLGDFSYRPGSDGEDEDRAFIASYLRRRHEGECLEPPEPDQIRRAIPKIWGAELNYDIRELIGVEA
jgi:hypothetical protein